ncbi:putative reverse transcriptase domain-containing protein [Tanacetum coccineum]
MPVTRQGANDAMTPESIQAMIDRAIQRNSTQDDGIQSSGGGIRRHVQPARVCSYPDFMKCQPLNFKGTKGVVGLSQWLKKMESIFHISGCVIENQVKFATCTLLGAALTWGNDVAAYTQRFQELALMCTKFLVDETVKIDKYIGGLPDNIHGNVMSARPKTLDFAIELTNDLMDQKLRTYAVRQNENKRKADDSSRNNHQQQPHKKQNVARAYTAGLGEKKVNTNNTNNNNKNQKDGACYECGNTKHMKRNCPKLKNRGNGNGNGPAQGRAYALGGRDASPDPNVITGTFLLNDHYAKILFDTGADRSFVSNTFSTLIDITPTTLENHYDIELADGKIIRVNTIIRAQEYLSKGCDVFLAHITTKKAKDKSEGKRLEDVPIVPGVAPVAQRLIDLHIRKERTGEQLIQELSDKGFIRPISSPWGARTCLTRRKDEVVSVCTSIIVAGTTKDKFLIVFIDDILIYSRNKKEHEEHLKLILELLKKEELYAKFSKCEFWIPKVQFLRHVIDSKGIYVDPAKIESIKDWASPKSAT